MVDEDSTIEEGQVEAEASSVSSVDEPAAGAGGAESGEPASSVAAEVAEATEAVESEVAAEPELSPDCLLYTSPSPRDRQKSRMPSSA